MISLVGFDLDGTLLTPDKKITQYTDRVLRLCAQKHIILVPVTGRPFSGIPQQILSMEFVHFAITSNGSVTGRVPVGDVIRCSLMGGDTVRAVLDAAGTGIIAEVFTQGTGYHDGETDLLLQEKYRNRPAILSYIRASRRTVPDLHAFLEGRQFENISLMFKNPAERDAAKRRIENIPGIRVIVPAPTDLEIVCEGADKGRALLQLASDLHVRPDDVMAVGDGSNDRELLACAGISVAMGNAKEDLKKMADYIAPDNEHDGLARALERFVLLPDKAAIEQMEENICTG